MEKSSCVSKDRDGAGWNGMVSFARFYDGRHKKCHRRFKRRQERNSLRQMVSAFYGGRFNGRTPLIAEGI